MVIKSKVPKKEDKVFSGMERDMITNHEKFFDSKVALREQSKFDLSL
jgi:hypothetical protein